MNNTLQNYCGLNAIKTLLIVAGLTLSVQVAAQITPPGYERELAEIEQRRHTNVMDRDSLIVIDTISLYDPETYVETMRIVQSKVSWRDYCMFRLGINQPEQLLNGTPLTLTDPRTFQQMTVQWNSSAGKLDTIRRQ